MTKPQIILASQSIGRKSLLEKLGVPFEVVPSTINEDIIIHQNPYIMLQMRANAKANDIYQRLASSQLGSSKTFTKRYPLNAGYLVIAADSMAVLNKNTFGKAKDTNHAKQILQDLMGKTHVFATATCIIYLSRHSGLVSESENKIRSRNKFGMTKTNFKELNRWENITKTRVTLGSLDASSLDAYVSRYDFTRFAAGYALNETPWDLVTKIDGSYTNVIGLPFEVILPILRSFDIV